jgi:hypothetical protein
MSDKAKFAAMQARKTAAAGQQQQNPLNWWQQGMLKVAQEKQREDQRLTRRKIDDALRYKQRTGGPSAELMAHGRRIGAI